MFMLVPKRAPKHPKPAETTTEEDSRGAVRTQNACDSCRVKKAKCNGQQPCKRCRDRRDICIYSRATRRDIPVNSAQVALLQHQQERMSAALREMASRLAKHESGQDKPASSFDVVDLLDRYAPTSTAKRQYPDATEKLIEERKRSRIEHCQQQPEATGTGPEAAQDQSPKPTNGDQATAAPGFGFGTDMPFVLEPVPGMHSDLSNGNNAYESMLQFMQMMGGTNQTPKPGPSQGSSQQIPAQTSSNIATGGVPSFPSAFMDLVDWEASLANFPANSLFTNETTSPSSMDMLGNENAQVIPDHTMTGNDSQYLDFPS